MSEWAAVDTFRATLLAQLQSGEIEHVPLCDRRQIWQPFGPYVKPANAPFVTVSRGLKRRFDLQLGCILRVLPEWEQVYPRSMIDDCINLALGYIQGGVPAEVVLGQAESKWHEFDNFIDDNDTPIAMLGFSAAKLLSTVLYDFDIDPEAVSSKPDLQFDFPDREISFDISQIVLRTARQSQRNPTQAMRDYWTWYLADAVPKAWAMGFQTEGR